MYVYVCMYVCLMQTHKTVFVLIMSLYTRINAPV